MIRKLSIAAAIGAAATLGFTGMATAGAAGANSPAAPAKAWQHQARPAAKPAALKPAAAACWNSAGHWWCNNKPGAPVYGAGSTGIVGYMYSNPSWFVCRQEGNSTGGGGVHPNRWEWTTADNGAQGWMKDSDIYSETDPLPTC